MAYDVSSIRLLPICLTNITKNQVKVKIDQISNVFYLSVRIGSFKKWTIPMIPMSKQI